MHNRTDHSTCTVLFISLLAAFFIPGCGGNKPSYPLPPAGATAGSIVTERRPVKIGNEMYDADFGTITVPENRANPASRTIHIPFLRVHSHATKPAEPVVGLAGGPGQSNTVWDLGKAATFLGQRDFLVVGYRGVDGPSRLDCPEVAEAFKGRGRLLSPESMRAIGEAWTAAAKRLQAQGIDLNSYTMLDCIEDNEDVRRALGYSRVDLLGESYGTRVAYLYGLRHPESIARTAMISVNPPGHFAWEARTIDAQLHRYAALWSADSLMSARCPDLYGAMRNVLSGMPRSWLLVPIDPDKVRIVTFALLAHRETAAKVFDSYVAAAEGDPSGLALMSVAYDFVLPSMMVLGDPASKAVSADFDPRQDYCQEPNPSVYPLGSPMNKLLWCPLAYGGWPVQPLPEEFRRVRRSDLETLLLSGSLDFSTPWEAAAQELLPHLSKGTQVILSECGHVGDVWYVHGNTTRRLLTSFFDTGVPDQSLNAYLPMSFAVSRGFPALAKMAAGAIVLVLLAAVLVTVWLLRRRARKSRSRRQGSVGGFHEEKESLALGGGAGAVKER